MKALIMAGGKGTRIASVRSDIPKPMIPVLGKPILEYQIERLKAAGITDITLITGHLGNAIRNYFGDGSAFGVSIIYFEETYPLGTAGALFKMELPDEDFILLNGDIIFDIDFERLVSFHRERGALASLVSHPNDHPFDSSLLVTEILSPETPGGLPVETGRVTAWLTKEDPREYYRNRVNAGIAVLSPELISYTRPVLVPRHPENPDKIDLDRDVLRPAISTGRIFAYDTPEYIKDMGTPERLSEVERDIALGRVSARNLANKQKAVFLDRDGTLNRHVGFLSDPSLFELLPGAAEAVKKIHEAGYLAIVVTNQPVIARGECSFEGLRLIHNKMETLLGREGAFLDAIYYCPHHPDSGFEGERLEYKRVCDCRKPAPGLLFQAVRDFNIDLSNSIMIGDGPADEAAGRAALCKESITIPTNTPGALLDALSANLDCIS